MRDLAPSVPITEIRFGFQITTLIIPKSLSTHELQPAFPSLFHDHIRCKNFSNCRPSPVAWPSLVADSRRLPLVCSLLLEDLSSAEINSTLHQREC